ncbi:MAG: Rid family detoxifying hydrolase [Acidobacteriota bacterium]|nr:Rid family detoxifying hydrolase [Acidobacteriota bacterium]
MRVLLALMLLLPQRHSVSPPGVVPVGPFSSGLMAGDTLYISGQGARDAEGKLPPTFEAQTNQCLKNVQAVAQAAGLTMDHVVYTHAYLTDMANYAALNQVYATYFTGTLPARSTMGVARMPLETPVEISAIAVRDLSSRKAVTLPDAISPVPLSPGIRTADRFYMSGILGRDAGANTTPATGSEQIAVCLSRIARVLSAAQLTGAHLLSLNVYRTAELPASQTEQAFRQAFPDAALSLIEVSSLPFGVQVGVTGVATLNAAEKQVYRAGGQTVCAATATAVYCSTEAADTVGEALRTVDARLRAMGTSLVQAVATNVYLNDIDIFQNMNAIYALQFATPYPARTTVQPQRTGFGAAVRISVTAAR